MKSQRPPDVESAVEALRDKMFMSGANAEKAILITADDWEVRPDVLLVRFQKQYGETPAQMYARLVTVSASKVVTVRSVAVEPTSSKNIGLVTAARPPIRVRNQGFQPTRATPVVSAPTLAGASSRLGTHGNPPCAPDPADFSLPFDFDLVEFQKRSDALDRDVNLLSAFALFSMAIILFVAGAPNILSVAASVAGFPFYRATFTRLIRFCSSERDEVFESRVFASAFDLAMKDWRRKFSRWEEAAEEWRQAQLETGFRYWTALRGVAFEEAVARLFKRRGCNASTTIATGDGGVDVKIIISGQTYWGQCKGHSNRIPVAPIREINGVCAAEGVRPVMFAVNGFTGPALQQAQKLGVICLDAPDLCRLASLKIISDLGEL